LKENAEKEVHKHQSGRILRKQADLTNPFTKGFKKLEGGVLAHWIAARYSILRKSGDKHPVHDAPAVGMKDAIIEDFDLDSGEDIAAGVCETLGTMEMVDGELQIQMFTPEEYLSPITQAMDKEEDDDKKAMENASM
jgi:hypothetical protein